MIFDETRGQGSSTQNDFYCKNDFTLSYDRLICLRDGEFTIFAHLHGDSSNDPLVEFLKNGVAISEAWHANDNETLHMVSMFSKFNTINGYFCSYIS